MTPKRLQEILNHFERVRVLVVGDLFLDKYLMIEPTLAETSLETGLEAHQVVVIRTSPGAAGTVLANLVSLGVGTVDVLSVIGDDGEGDDLRRGLKRLGVSSENLLVAPARFTPTYTKPMRLVPGGPAVEMSRLDHKNRTPLPHVIEAEIVARLRRLAPGVDAVIVADQVEEANCGVVTGTVRDEIARLAEAHPNVVFYADSRVRIGWFRGCLVKPNLREAVYALDPTGNTPLSWENGTTAARTLARQNRKPVFLTLSEDGMLVVESDGDSVMHAPGVSVEGPTDPVGAGDSATAGIVGALCSGATPVEAALVGNLVASLTVQQIGTTGTTTRADVLERRSRYRDADRDGRAGGAQT